MFKYPLKFKKSEKRAQNFIVLYQGSVDETVRPPQQYAAV